MSLAEDRDMVGASFTAVTVRVKVWVTESAPPASSSTFKCYGCSSVFIGGGCIGEVAAGVNCWTDGKQGIIIGGYSSRECLAVFISSTPSSIVAKLEIV